VPEPGSGLYSCILVGYDGSDAARRAVERALGLARLSGAKLVVATVVPPPTVFLGELLLPEVVDLNTIEEPARRQLEALVKEIREAAGFDRVEPVILVGDPADELVHYAEENGCDLIVVGRRGRGGLERLILGSVSSKIVNISHGVDVLVVESASLRGKKEKK
jgi:nucleotide-binding universal stress UspA family protein